jgi:hypothetical protein
LSTSSQIYADGTFSHCTKIFKQLFTAHGYKNVHYVPPSSRFLKLFLDSVTYNAFPNRNGTGTEQERSRNVTGTEQERNRNGTNWSFPLNLSTTLDK